MTGSDAEDLKLARRLAVEARGQVERMLERLEVWQHEAAWMTTTARMTRALAGLSQRNLHEAKKFHKALLAYKYELGRTIEEVEARERELRREGLRGLLEDTPAEGGASPVAA